MGTTDSAAARAGSAARRLAALSAVLPVLVGCAGPAPDPAPDASAAAGQRPVVELSFDVAADLGSVTGRESVVFSPDLRTCELVFRAWPNNPTMSQEGASLVVTEASVDGAGVTPVVQAAGAPAGAAGTLIQLPLARCVEPGQPVRADIGFRLQLGANADERVGHSPQTGTAWFGTGFPLLAWVRGQGWATDPAVPMNGEAAVSEAFQLSTLSVTAATEYRVMGTGSAAAPTDGPGAGRTTHRFTADAVRDLTVAVGRYNVLDRDVAGVRLHVATPTAGTQVAPANWADQISGAITALTPVLGPFPYPELWVTITPGQSDGTEFPAAVQLGDVEASELPALVAHEIAHQWFYALVGNNQAQHPWLDESLATFSESIALGAPDEYDLDDIPPQVRGQMGRPMSYWATNGGFDRYVEGVYDQGAAALLQARSTIGAERFDAALRSYIAANAHHVATPDSFARAFADQPPVLDQLRQAGALPGNR